MRHEMCQHGQRVLHLRRVLLQQLPLRPQDLKNSAVNIGQLNDVQACHVTNLALRLEHVLRDSKPLLHHARHQLDQGLKHHLRELRSERKQ